MMNIRQSILNREISLKEGLEYYLNQISQKNKLLNAIIEVYDDVYEQVNVIEDKHRAGVMLPLYGYFVVVKDNICVKGKEVTAASRILKGFRSPYSATVVERMVDAGVVLIGRANCDEFAMGSSNENSFYGPARHPFHENLVPGGSSGGCASAIAADMCNLALGSDTGGSVRQPAAFCGIAGFKPTYGLFSRYGLIAYASSLDQIGLMAKYVNDIKNGFYVCAGPDGRDATCIDFKKTFPDFRKPQTVAIMQNCINHPRVAENIRNAFNSLIELLKEEEINIIEADLPYLDFLMPVYYIIACAEASSNLARYDGIRYGYRASDYSDVDELIRKSRGEGFGLEVKRRIITGTFVLSSGYYDAYYKKAQKARALIKREIDRIFEKAEYILLPASPSLPFEIGSKRDLVEMYLEDIFTVTANLCGIPAISIPYPLGNGFFAGIQIMGKQLSDEELLDFAEFLQTRISLNELST